MSGSKRRHLRIPLVPGIRNAVQENDRLARAGLDIMPRQIFRITGRRDEVMSESNPVNNLGITFLIFLTRLHMRKMFHTLFDTRFVRNESFDCLAAALGYFGILMRAFQSFD